MLRATVIALLLGQASIAHAETVEENVAYLLYQVEAGGRIQRGAAEELVLAHASAAPATYQTRAHLKGALPADMAHLTYRVEKTGACTFKGAMSIADDDKTSTMQTLADFSTPMEVSTTPPDDPGISLTGHKPCSFDIEHNERTRDGTKRDRKCEASYHAPVDAPDLDRLKRTLAAVQASCGAGRSQ